MVEKTDLSFRIVDTAALPCARTAPLKALFGSGYNIIFGKCRDFPLSVG